MVYLWETEVVNIGMTFLTKLETSPVFSVIPFLFEDLLQDTMLYLVGFTF